MQCCGSMTFRCGSGPGSRSGDPCFWPMDPDKFRIRIRPEVSFGFGSRSKNWPKPHFFVLMNKVRNKFAGFGSGSISKRHGSVDPDPYQKVTDPQHCAQLLVNVFYCTAIVATTFKFVHITICTTLFQPENKAVLKIFYGSSFGSGFESGSETFISVPNRIRIRQKVSDSSGSGSGSGSGTLPDPNSVIQCSDLRIRIRLKMLCIRNTGVSCFIFTIYLILIPVLRIRDVYPGSRIRLFCFPDPGSELSPSRIPDPHQRI